MEAPENPARCKPVEHFELHRAAHVELRGRVDHRDRRVAPPAHDRGLDRQAVRPARPDVGHARGRLQAREHPREVARARALPRRLACRGEGGRGVVDLQQDARGQDRAQGGLEDSACEVGGELGVEERGEGVRGVRRAGESGVGHFGGGARGERDGGNAFLGAFRCRGAVGVQVSISSAKGGVVIGTYKVPDVCVLPGPKISGREGLGQFGLAGEKLGHAYYRRWDR